MKFTVFAAIVAMLAGCSDRPTVPGVDRVGDEEKFIFNDGSPVTYRIIVIDGCEYIFGRDHGGYNGGYFLTHKGDCKSKSHQQPAGSH